MIGATCGRGARQAERDGASGEVCGGVPPGIVAGGERDRRERGMDGLLRYLLEMSFIAIAVVAVVAFSVFIANRRDRDR